MNSFHKLDVNFISQLFYNDYTPHSAGKSQIIYALLEKNESPLLDLIVETDENTGKKILKCSSTDENNFRTLKNFSPCELTSEILGTVIDEIDRKEKLLPDVDVSVLKEIKRDVDNKNEEYLIEEQIIEGNIKEAVNAYNTIYENEKKEIPYADIDWKNRTLYERAAVISEYYSKHPDIDIKKYIDSVHENPEIVNTLENKKILDNIPKNSKQRCALMYNTFAANFDIELVPPKYKIESFFQNTNNGNVLKETKYCDDKETLYQYAALIDSHYKTHLISEIRSNDSENKLYYEVSKQRNVNFESGVYIGKVDAIELTRVYNNEKNPLAEPLKENVSKILLNYLESKGITVEENVTIKGESSFTVKDNNGNFETGDITKVFEQASFCAVNDRIRKIQENHNDNKKHIFANEDCVLFDKIKKLSDTLKDNYLNGQSEEYKKTQERINTLNKQLNFLSVNNIIFENNYKNNMTQNQNTVINSRITEGLTEKQLEALNKEFIKNAEQMKKINELTKNNSNKPKR